MRHVTAAEVRFCPVMLKALILHEFKARFSLIALMHFNSHALKLKLRFFPNRLMAVLLHALYASSSLPFLTFPILSMTCSAISSLT